MIIRSTMATWCFYCVFLLCVVNHCCKEHSAVDGRLQRIEVCSTKQTRGNVVQLYRDKDTDIRRVCECMAKIDTPNCMKMTFFEGKEKDSGSCTFFHQLQLPPDENCTIQILRDGDCTRKAVLRFKPDKIQGSIMNISVLMNDSRSKALICSHRIEPRKPPPAEVLRCTAGSNIHVTNIYVGAKGKGKSGCLDNKQKISGQEPYCCKMEEGDFHFNVSDLTDRQKYDNLTQSVNACNTQTQCNVSDTIVPIKGQNMTGRKYSSYFIVEYECKADNEQGGQADFHVSCSTRSSTNTTDEDEDEDKDEDREEGKEGKVTTTTAVDQSTHSNETKGGMKVEPEVTTTTAVDQSTHSNETKGGMKVEPEDKLLTYVIAGVVAGVFLVIVIVTVLICIRKRRSSDDKHVYMTVERTAGQELQTFAGGNTNDGRQREDGFEDIPLESDNELDPLYDQADQQDLHSGAHTCKSDGTSSEDVYDHTNNKSGIRASAIATTASGGRDEDDTYDHAGDSCKKTKERPTPLSDEDLYDHTGGPSGGPTRDLAGGPSGGPKNLVQGGVYGKLNHDDDVYDHAIRQSLKSPSNTDCASNTYGRLNLNPEDGDVHNHTGAGEKKVDVIDEQYTTLNP